MSLKKLLISRYQVTRLVKSVKLFSIFDEKFYGENFHVHSKYFYVSQLFVKIPDVVMYTLNASMSTHFSIA